MALMMAGCGPIFCNCPRRLAVRAKSMAWPLGDCSSGCSRQHQLLVLVVERPQVDEPLLGGNRTVRQVRQAVDDPAFAWLRGTAAGSPAAVPVVRTGR